MNSGECNKERKKKKRVQIEKPCYIKKKGDEVNCRAGFEKEYRKERTATGRPENTEVVGRKGENE